MFDQFPVLAQVVDVFTTIVLVCLGILAILCLIRAILGPKVADRLVAVNMLGTMVMVMIATLAVKLNEGFLADVCLIYAMISFLAVIVGTRIYMESYLEKLEEDQ
jgi:multicomponent Na+:H+ antiporter subunit F